MKSLKHPEGGGMADFFLGINTSSQLMSKYILEWSWDFFLPSVLICIRTSSSWLRTMRNITCSTYYKSSLKFKRKKNHPRPNFRNAT